MRTAVASLCLAGLLTPPSVGAFCGFYVSGAAEDLHNPASSVVLMRDGTRTVVSMQNHYEGPPQDFAMVVPVPVVLSRDDVRTLPAEVFDRVDHLDSPRLVEYWEQDPCGTGIGDGFGIGLGGIGTIGHGSGGGGAGSLGVHVEARFAVGEYDVVVLSASDSTGLDTWLHNEHYNIPQGAAPLLDPYVRMGMKFFVARVDVRRVHFENGRAQLSPLRFDYDADTFSLPIRLGLINSPGTQDLVVHVLSHNQRYEVANRENVTIPTNLDVAPSVRESFGGFYAALFDHVLEQHPNAVVTEYAWQSGSCDPCPTPPLTDSELMTLGADVLPATQAAIAQTTQQAEVALRIETPTVTGPLSVADAQGVASRSQGPMARCLSQSGSVQSGRVTLRLPVLANGGVSTPTVLSAPDGTMPAARCMATEAARWHFPANVQGGSTVDLPITLASDARRTGPGVSTLREYLRTMVLTRLHTRYGRNSTGEDLVFRAAPPITGGREVYGVSRQLERGFTSATGGVSNFQGRYAIRHPWQGPVACAHPQRGNWGPPPADTVTTASTLSAPPTAFTARTTTPLRSLVLSPVPELHLAAATVPVVSPPETPTPHNIPTRPARHGCSIAVEAGHHEGSWAAAMASLVLLSMGRSRRRR